jgi:hypothetical protein
LGSGEWVWGLVGGLVGGGGGGGGLSSANFLRFFVGFWKFLWGGLGMMMSVDFERGLFFVRGLGSGVGSLARF